MKILLIEDERLTRVTMTHNLTNAGYEVIACADGDEGWKAMDSDSPDAIVTDLRLPGINGMEILERARGFTPPVPVILVTAFATVENAVEALRLGAYDYLTKPFAPQELLNILGNIDRYQTLLRENEKLRERIRDIADSPIVGNSPPMRQLRQTISAIAPGDHTILIEGESGTGKEVVAHAIHNQSARNKGPFVAINCCAIPESLMEGELFGYLKGAFSGAVRNHAGYFEQAENGTLFIDDIDDLPLNIQVKLLRVIQERQVVRLGDEKTVPINIRLIAATKKNLQQMVQEGLFRDDLFYRLNVIPIQIPPLAERKEDIPMLVSHFLVKHAQPDFPHPEINIKPLMDYSWPGNVRELENLVERIIALPNAGFEELLRSVPAATVVPEAQIQPPQTDRYPLDLQQTVNGFEKSLIGDALQQCSGNVTAAAKLLSIPRSTLQSKIEKLGME